VNIVSSTSHVTVCTSVYRSRDALVVVVAEDREEDVVEVEGTIWVQCWCRWARLHIAFLSRIPSTSSTPPRYSPVHL